MEQLVTTTTAADIIMPLPWIGQNVSQIVRQSQELQTAAAALEQHEYIVHLN